MVAKTMSRLANLLMQAPVDPAAPQLAPHFASNAVAIADSALQVRLAQCMAAVGSTQLVNTQMLSGLAGVLCQRVEWSARCRVCSPLLRNDSAVVALQNAQRTSLWRGVVRGALKAVQTASFGGYRAGLEAGGSCNEESRQRAALALPLLNSVYLQTRRQVARSPSPNLTSANPTDLQSARVTG